MTTTPFETLIMFGESLRDLDMAQSWIDASREANANNQEKQLQLDRRQALVDSRRTQIEHAMLHIASSN